MPRYRNVGGSPWRRPSGEMVPPGGTFDATGREYNRILRRGYYRNRLQPMGEPAETAVLTATQPSGEVATWPLRMGPATYLKLHPKGPHAPLARIIVAQGGK